MKLRDYIKQLQQIVSANPKAADLDVIYAKDEEGNGFGPVYYSPTVGKFDGHYEFDGFDKGDKRKPNAVCIN